MRCGTDTDSQLNIAKNICDRLGFNLYSLEAAILPVHPGELEQLQHRWQREAILGNNVLWIDGALAFSSERRLSLQRFLANLKTPIILNSRDRQHFPHCPVISWDISPLSHAERQHLWESHLGETAAELDGHLDPLIAQFNLNPRTIQAASASIQSERDNIPERLWTFCRQQARPRLEHLAQRIETTATWDDLVLPTKETAILRDLATQVKQRTTVYERWGFARKSNRGLGISVLFAGASGTGKTMAAEVLAREFNLDLYRIDLSAVTSKYIGETEKNLAQIFDAAEMGGAVLLFDEADALFGKRTQVKDSRDRHANIEVSYLLQRMEAYQGLAILTTNLRDALDQAFLRRLRFIVNFPFPKANARSEIWQQIFPEQTPTQSLNFRRLGQLDVAGGNIRAIALNAAFIAAEAKEPVTMRHILQATRSEYLKIGRSLTSVETQGWV
ncbi:MAG: AAA family ATPase [Cyanobacteria bacterium P01_E01_bin.42]